MYSKHCHEGDCLQLKVETKRKEKQTARHSSQLHRKHRKQSISTVSASYSKQLVKRNSSKRLVTRIPITPQTPQSQDAETRRRKEQQPSSNQNKSRFPGQSKDTPTPRNQRPNIAIITTAGAGKGHSRIPAHNEKSDRSCTRNIPATPSRSVAAISAHHAQTSALGFKPRAPVGHRSHPTDR